MRSLGLTRRALLGDGVKLVAGAGLVTAATGLVAACRQPEAAASPTAAAAALAAPGWPWPYAPLDPQAVAQKGYDSYYEAGCMYGAFNALITSLKEHVGYPYTLMPTQMARYGEGGVVGWASLCGALNGSAAAINLVLKEYSPAINDLVDWYTKTSFPIMTPSAAKTNVSGTSVSGSPLCHVSVTEWCNASGFKAESPQRAERCARLTADVAKRAAEILNQQATGEFKVSYKAASSLAQCGGCHLKGGTIEDARGKMDCVQCHEPHAAR